MPTRKIDSTKPFYRTVQFDRAAVDDTARQVRLSVSSDVPYQRFDFYGEPYFEVLDHSPAGIDTTRLADGISLLWNHDVSQPLGRSQSFENDGHKLSITAKFSRSAFAQEKWVDVVDQVLVNASLGYSVLDAEELDQKIDGIPVYRMKFSPLEASLVCVAADISVGIGRSATQPQHTRTMETKTTPQETTPTTRMTKSDHEIHADKIRELATYFATSRTNFARFLPFNVEVEAEKCIAQHMTNSEFQKHVTEAMNMSSGDDQILTHGDDPSTPSHGRSIGEQIVQRRDFQVFAKSSDRNKRVHIELPQQGVRTLTTASAGLTGIDKLPYVIGLGAQALLVADLVGQGVTEAPTVRFLRENTLTLAATAVAEGQTKPTSDLDLQEVDAAVRKLAITAKLSSEMIDDFPQTATFLNSRLGYEVGAELDNQILNGSGIAPNLLGIRSTGGILTQAVGADTPLDAIFKAMSAIRSIGFYQPDGIVISPNTWAKLRLLKDNNAQYFAGGPFYVPYGGGGQLMELQVEKLWGLPVAITVKIPDGVALVGNFRQCAFLFYRHGLSIGMGYSDDDFQRNLVSVRCEIRAALAVMRPSCFCEVTGLP